MTLNPLAIALQGIGFGALLVALQGFSSAVALVEPPGGGSGGGGGFLRRRPFLRPDLRPWLGPVEEDEALFFAVLNR